MAFASSCSFRSYYLLRKLIPVTCNNSFVFVTYFLICVCLKSLVFTEIVHSQFWENSNQISLATIFPSSLRSFTVPPSLLRTVVNDTFLKLNENPLADETDDDNDKTNAFSRITGGTETSPNEFPWQTYIQIVMASGSSHSCGGSLISNRWILTAANCFLRSGQKPEEISVVLGMRNRLLLKEVGRQMYSHNISFYTHPSFDNSTLEGDIALLQLPTNVSFSDSVRPIEIANSFEPNYVNSFVTLTGWGLTDISIPSTLSGTLRGATVRIISNHHCQLYFNSEITNGMMCTSESNYRGACFGDSGGPMSYQQPDGNWKQLGITSFISERGCKSGYPNGFTRISSYASWIEKTINEITTPSISTSTTTSFLPTSIPLYSSSTNLLLTSFAHSVAPSMSSSSPLVITSLASPPSLTSSMAFSASSSNSYSTSLIASIKTSSDFSSTLPHSSSKPPHFWSTSSSSLSMESGSSLTESDSSATPPPPPASDTTTISLSSSSIESCSMVCVSSSTSTISLTMPTQTTSTESTTVFSCMENGNYPDPAEQCSKTFYMCSNGNKFKFICPDGLVYEQKLGICDHPYNVASCNMQTPIN